MKKWMLLLTPAFLMGSSVDAWGGRGASSASAARTDSSKIDNHFPLNSDQGWFTEESYLLLKPTLGNLDYGDMITANSFGPNATDFKIKVKNPDFDWNSGVRIGIGRYLPNHDKWDISFYTTYFYGTAHDHTKGNISQYKALAVNYAPYATILSEKTKASWRLNYFVFDLMTGRQFAMTPQIMVHPYVGLRGTVIYNDYNSKNSGAVTFKLLNQDITVDSNIRISMDQDFWGIGPRVGSNFDYKFTGNWSFLGNLSATLLYGHYDVKNKTKTDFTVSNFTAPNNVTALDHNNVIRANLEGAIGLGWERWFKNNTVRIAPNFQFEGSLWFNMNDFFQPLSVFSQDHGNLALMGFSFNLQVDF